MRAPCANRNVCTVHIPHCITSLTGLAYFACVCVHVGAWYGVLAVVSQLAVVTNALLIAITSNFVGFEVYIRGGYRDEYNNTEDLVPRDNGYDQGLSGYANWSSTVFDVIDLVDGEAFPAYSAQGLQYVNDDGSDVRVISGGNPDDTPLFLPFIDFSCLNTSATSVRCDLDTTKIGVKRFIYNGSMDAEETVETFTDTQYKRFYNSRNCRSLLINASSDDSPEEGSIAESSCFIRDHQCRLAVYSACRCTCAYMYTMCRGKL